MESFNDIEATQNDSVELIYTDTTDYTELGVLFKSAYIFGVLVLFMAVVGFIAISSIKLTRYDCAALVYFDLICDYISLVFIGLFMIFWRYHAIGKLKTEGQNVWFKRITILSAIAGCVNALCVMHYITDLFVYCHGYDAWDVILYVLSLVIWLSVALFFYTFAKIILKKHEALPSINLLKDTRSDIAHFIRILCSLFIIVLVGFWIYVINDNSPEVFIYDCIAWISMAVIVWLLAKEKLAITNVFQSIKIFKKLIFVSSVILFVRALLNVIFKLIYLENNDWIRLCLGLSYTISLLLFCCFLLGYWTSKTIDKE